MSDIDDFLRRAAQRRKSGQPQQPQKPATQRPVKKPVIEILEPVHVEPLIDAEVIDAEPVSGDDVGQHVAQHLDTSSFSDRASHMAEEVGHADDKLESRLHSTFDHQVGRLSHGDQVSAVSPENPEEVTRDRSATGIEVLGLLQNPKTLRDAVILAEIFKRPEW